MSEEQWKPTFIDIEAEFSKFIQTFRGGSLVTDYVTNIPDSVLNADFYFPNDNVIAELKVMTSDASNSEAYTKRIMDAATHFGHTGSEIMGWFLRGEEIPERVKRRVYSSSYRSIVESIKKANKQIASTRHLLRQPKARGLVLLANDRNMMFSIAGMTDISVKSFHALRKIEMDCLVYFTPNVFHDIGDGIAHQIWSPIYNVGSEDFGDFVNDFGKAWLDYLELTRGKAMHREARDDLLEKYIEGQPIKQFARSN